MPIQVTLEQATRDWSHKEVPELTPKERSEILGAGLKPEEWVSDLGLRKYWELSSSAYKLAYERGQLPKPVILGRRHYYHKSGIVKDWQADTDVDEYTQQVIENPIQLSTVKSPVAYQKVLNEQVTARDWIEIVMRAVDDAKVGDWKARKWLSDYLIGTPIQRIAAEVKKVDKFTDDERRAALIALLGAEEIDLSGTVVDGVITHSEEIS